MRLCVANPDVVLLHQRLKIAALHSGLLGAACHVPAVSFQRAENEKLFDVFYGVFPCNLLDVLALLAGLRHIQIIVRQHIDDIHEVTLAYYIATRKNDGAVHHIFQFSDVARPIKVH